ncbi:MAG: SRPBCC domain-containing protein [Lapillicoccus sp.]
MFSWDISPRWEVVTDPEQTSEVEVRFVPETDARTRVVLEHRHLERHGSGWDALRDGVDGADGWPRYLARFRDLFPRGPE